MATYEVSTWAELITELSTNRSESKTIKLITDIDCNNEIPTGVATTIVCYCSHTYPVTIDGSYSENGVIKNHVIRNLRTDVVTPVSIFKLTPNNDSVFEIKFKNIDFINLIFLDVNFFSIVASYLTSNNHIYFEKCRFVGKRNRPFVVRYGWNGSNDTIEMNSCFFNIPYKSTTPNKDDVPLFGDWFPTSATTNYSIFANFCRFRSNYDNWSNANTVTPLQFIKMSGCYVDGDIVGESSITIGKYDYDSSIQNVIDANLWVKTGTAGSSISVYAPKGIYKNQIRKWGDESTSYVDSKQYAGSISVSPSDMTNPQALYDAGFDIVVPE